MSECMTAYFSKLKFFNNSLLPSTVYFSNEDIMILLCTKKILKYYGRIKKGLEDSFDTKKVKAC